MNTVRCPKCRTIANAGYRFCYVCGAEYAAAMPQAAFAPPFAEREARQATSGASVMLVVFGLLGAIGGIYAAMLVDIEAWKKALLLLLLIGGAVFGFVSTCSQSSQYAAVGRMVLRGFAAIAWAILIGLVVCVGIVIYLFALCVGQVGKY